MCLLVILNTEQGNLLKGIVICTVDICRYENLESLGKCFVPIKFLIFKPEVPALGLLYPHLFALEYLDVFLTPNRFF